MTQKHEGHEFLTMLVAGNIFAESVDNIRASRHKDLVRKRVKKGINDTLEALEKDCKPMYDLVFGLKEMDEYYVAMVKAMSDMAEMIVSVEPQKWPELYAVMNAYINGQIKIQDAEPEHTAV